MGTKFTSLIIVAFLMLSMCAGALERGAATQVYFTAILSTDGSFKTGDAGQITADISKDGGADAPLTDSTATEVDATNMPGLYWFDVSGTETTADVIAIQASSSTSNIVLDPVTIYTDDVANYKADVSALALAATALSDLTWTDAKAAFIDALISSRSDFDATADPVAVVTLVTTTTTNTDMRGTNSASTHSAADVWGVVTRTLTDPNSYKADVSALALEATVSALNDFDPAVDAVATVTTVGTTTTNTDMVTEPPTVGEIDTELTSSHGAGDWITGGGGSAPTVEEIDAELTANHGAGSWSVTPLAGVYVFTWTQTDDPVGDVLCEIYTDAEATIFETSDRTDPFGIAKFWLEPGDYYLVRKLSGRVFSNPTLITVVMP